MSTKRLIRRWPGGYREGEHLLALVVSQIDGTDHGMVEVVVVAAPDDGSVPSGCVPVRLPSGRILPVFADDLERYDDELDKKSAQKCGQWICRMCGARECELFCGDFVVAKEDPKKEKWRVIMAYKKYVTDGDIPIEPLEPDKDVRPVEPITTSIRYVVPDCTWRNG